MLSVHGKYDIALTIAIGILGQLSDGLRRLTHLYEGGDQIALSLDEFHSICIKLGGGNFLSDDNTLSASQFEAMIRQHLAVFVQRQLAFGSLWEDEKRSFSCTQAMIQGIKLIILNLDSGSAGADSLPTNGPQIDLNAHTHQTMPAPLAAHNGGHGFASLSPHSSNAHTMFPEANHTPNSVERIWNQYAPGPGEASKEASTNARLDRLERITLHLCDKVDQVLSRLDESAKPGPTSTGLGGLAGAPFRSANLLGLRSALGLGPGEGVSGGGDGDGGGGGTTFRDLLMPSSSNSDKVPALSPRFRMPRTAEEAWSQKTEARLKRRARRSALENSPPASATTLNEALQPTTPRGGVDGRRGGAGSRNSAFSPGTTEPKSSIRYPNRNAASS